LLAGTGRHHCVLHGSPVRCCRVHDTRPHWIGDQRAATFTYQTRRACPAARTVYGGNDEGDLVPFIQIIEYKTSRIEELNAALDGWLEATKGKRAASRGVQTSDRDAAGTYLQIVEFPSYEEAMANSNLPETGEFAAKLASLCDGPPTFRNLDVLREEQM
jgi:hypothetical protein